MNSVMNTPCPGSVNQTATFDDTFTEGTTNIEYTTAFDASFRNVKPRRGNATRHKTTNFSIHEDVEIKSERQQTTLAQPARRIIPAIKASKPQVCDEVAMLEKKASVQITRHAKRGGVPALHKEEHSIEHVAPASALKQNDSCSGRRSDVGPRPRRRDTLYIPSENTTQPTMWMGIFSPLKQEVSEENECGSADHQELTGIAMRMIEMRGNKTKNAELKARRKPLHPSKAISEQVNTIRVQAGEPTGKENHPPSQLASRQITTKSKSSSAAADMKSVASTVDMQRKSFLRQARLKHLAQPKTLPSQVIPDISTMYEIGTHALYAHGPKLGQNSHQARSQSIAKSGSSFERSSTADTVPALLKAYSNTKVSSNPTKFVQARLKDLPTVPMQIPISEHIENPSLYEEDWLKHQEIVITQLLNALFKQSGADEGDDVDQSVLRARLLDKYNSPELHLIHNRVQAAALYGSLSLSHEAMFNLHNLAHDVGRKQAFVKFWFNYDVDLLQVALETVSGKRIPHQNQKCLPFTKPAPTDKIKLVVRFVESYLLQHEDGQFKSAGTGSINDLGSKTILKSIMLIKALDLIKDEAEQLSSKCLFRKGSSLKSSTVAVQFMMRMLNTSVGDPIRALRQLGYEVSHAQKPMDDITFGIDNLAIDMRDGVNLARLVEILSYGPKTEGSSITHSDEHQTVSVGGDGVVDIDGSQSSPLVQHLKLPCPSKATKIWNVQLSLEALRHVHSMKPFMKDINAADIVDGHREKTIQLLWAMVGQSSLTQLIDGDDLQREIHRLNYSDQKGVDTLESDDNFVSTHERLGYLIKAWARAVAASRGLTVRNFSTSFADGQVFRTILDEYEPYLCKGEGSTHLPLMLRLLNLGCSKQFADLFDSQSGQIYILGKDCVLAALVFLCSRVMGPSKAWRNAVRIQRCWRKHWSKVAQKRQAVKKELAVACAAAVNFRLCTNELIGTETNVDQIAGMMAKSEIEIDIWLSI